MKPFVGVSFDGCGCLFWLALAFVFLMAVAR